MITHRGRRLTTNLSTACLLCLLLLTLAPASPGQKPGAAEVAALVKLLKDKDAEARMVGAMRLIMSGVEVRAAYSAIVEIVKDEGADVRVRLSALDLLDSLPSRVTLPERPEARPAVIPVLTEALGDENHLVRHSALKALAILARDKADVPSLVKDLKGKDARVRAVAAARLASLGEKAKIPRWASLGEKAKAALPALGELMKADDKYTRWVAVYALAEIGPAARAVPALIEFLKDEDKNLRRWGGGRGGGGGGAARPAGPALTAAVGDEDALLRLSAASALGRIGRDAQAAAPSLIKLLKDPVAKVRAVVAGTLAFGEFVPEAGITVPALVEALKDEDSEVRWLAAWALRKFGPAAQAATPLLAGLLKAQDSLNRGVAASALRAIGPGAREAVPALLKSLHDRNETVRVAAATALLKIAPESEAKITPALLKQAKARVEEMERKGTDFDGLFPSNPPPKWAEADTHLVHGHTLSKRISALFRGGPARPEVDSKKSGELLNHVLSGHDFYHVRALNAAAASYTKAVALDPHYSEAYYGRGLVHRARGDYAAALADFTRAIKAEPEPSEHYYYARGRTQIDRRDYDAAITDFTEAIKLDAYHADAYHRRGVAHHRKRDYGAAIADYDRAVEIVPPAVEAFGARGRAKLAQGKAAEALADFDEAVGAEPKNAANHSSRGDALKALGRLDAAEASYREALRAAPDAPVVLNHFGSFLVEQDKNLTEALGLLRRAVAAQPSNPAFLHSLGRAHFKLGQLDEAERRLSESVRRGGKSALAYEHLGDVYALRGKAQSARDAWGKALSLSAGAEAQARLKGKSGGAVKE